MTMKNRSNLLVLISVIAGFINLSEEYGTKGGQPNFSHSYSSSSASAHASSFSSSNSYSYGSGTEQGKLPIIGPIPIASSSATAAASAGAASAHAVAGSGSYNHDVTLQGAGGLTGNGEKGVSHTAEPKNQISGGLYSFGGAKTTEPSLIPDSSIGTSYSNTGNSAGGFSYQNQDKISTDKVVGFGNSGLEQTSGGYYSSGGVKPAGSSLVPTSSSGSSYSNTGSAAGTFNYQNQDKISTDKVVGFGNSGLEQTSGGFYSSGGVKPSLVPTSSSGSSYSNTGSAEGSFNYQNQDKISSDKAVGFGNSGLDQTNGGFYTFGGVKPAGSSLVPTSSSGSSYSNTGSAAGSFNYQNQDKISTDKVIGFGYAGPEKTNEVKANGGISGIYQPDQSFDKKYFQPVDPILPQHGEGQKVNEEENTVTAKKPPCCKKVFPGPDGSIYDYKVPPQLDTITGHQGTSVYGQTTTGIASGSYGGNKAIQFSGVGSYDTNIKSKPCCKGPFPGPSGSIYDSKPASAVGTGVHQTVSYQPSRPAVLPNRPPTNFDGSSDYSYTSKPVVEKINYGYQNKDQSSSSAAAGTYQTHYVSSTGPAPSCTKPPCTKELSTPQALPPIALLQPSIAKEKPIIENVKDEPVVQINIGSGYIPPKQSPKPTSQDKVGVVTIPQPQSYNTPVQHTTEFSYNIPSPQVPKIVPSYSEAKPQDIPQIPKESVESSYNVPSPQVALVPKIVPSYSEPKPQDIPQITAQGPQQNIPKESGESSYNVPSPQAASVPKIVPNYSEPKPQDIPQYPAQGPQQNIPKGSGESSYNVPSSQVTSAPEIVPSYSEPKLQDIPQIPAQAPQQNIPKAGGISHSGSTIIQGSISGSNSGSYSATSGYSPDIPTKSDTSHVTIAVPNVQDNNQNGDKSVGNSYSRPSGTYSGLVGHSVVIDENHKKDGQAGIIYVSNPIAQTSYSYNFSGATTSQGQTSSATGNAVIGGGLQEGIRGSPSFQPNHFPKTIPQFVYTDKHGEGVSSATAHSKSTATYQPFDKKTFIIPVNKNIEQEVPQTQSGGSYFTSGTGVYSFGSKTSEASSGVTDDSKVIFGDLPAKIPQSTGVQQTGVSSISPATNTEIQPTGTYTSTLYIDLSKPSSVNKDRTIIFTKPENTKKIVDGNKVYYVGGGSISKLGSTDHTSVAGVSSVSGSHGSSMGGFSSSSVGYSGPRSIPCSHGCRGTSYRHYSNAVPSTVTKNYAIHINPIPFATSGSYGGAHRSQNTDGSYGSLNSHKSAGSYGSYQGADSGDTSYEASRAGTYGASGSGSYTGHLSKGALNSNYGKTGSGGFLSSIFLDGESDATGNSGSYAKAGGYASSGSLSKTNSFASSSSYASASSGAYSSSHY